MNYDKKVGERSLLQINHIIRSLFFLLAVHVQDLFRENLDLHSQLNILGLKLLLVQVPALLHDLGCFSVCVLLQGLSLLVHSEPITLS